MMLSASSAFTVSMHIVAVVAGAAVALAHDVQLPVMREAAGVLRVAAVDRVAERLDPPLRLAREPDAAHQLPIHRRGLLALAQIGERGGALLRRDAIGDAAAGAAEIEPEHEAGPLRRAAMVERIDAERAMQPMMCAGTRSAYSKPGRQISEP